MKKSNERKNFDDAMDAILKADPAKVKAAMEAEKKERAATRKVKRTQDEESQ